MKTKTVALTICLALTIVILSFGSAFAFTRIVSVPEPSTLSLLGVVIAELVGMGAFGKRK